MLINIADFMKGLMPRLRTQFLGELTANVLKVQSCQDPVEASCREEEVPSQMECVVMLLMRQLGLWTSFVRLIP